MTDTLKPCGEVTEAMIVAASRFWLSIECIAELGDDELFGGIYLAMNAARATPPVDEGMVERVDAALDTQRVIRLYYSDTGRRRLAEKVIAALTVDQPSTEGEGA